MKEKCLVRDHGLFLCVAQRLAKDFGDVGYFTDWENGAPTPSMDHVGEGLPGITRVNTWEDYIEEERPSLIVFPDVGHGSMQRRERNLGNTVFGTGRGEVLEDDRIFFRKILEKKGLPVAPYDTAFSIDDLREKLKKVKDKYVKISLYRGIGETFHHKSYEYPETKTTLAEWEKELGILDKEVDFIIEDPIKAFVENIAIEWFFTKEGPLNRGLIGIENKNSFYLGKSIEYKDIPGSIKTVSDAFVPVFRKYDVRGAVSLEGHITEDNKFYYDDPCMRFGRPPVGSIVNSYKNFTPIAKSVAEGKLIDAEMLSKYVIEVMLQVREPGKGQIPIEFPEKYADNVIIANLCKIDGRYIHLAQDKEPIIGSVVATGNSIYDARDEALEIAAKVKGPGVYFDKDGFDMIEETIKKAKRIGINF